MGAALGSTIFENLALTTGIGLVLGALVDLRRSGEAVAGTAFVPATRCRRESNGIVGAEGGPRPPLQQRRS
jgi:hypothetical protein